MPYSTKYGLTVRGTGRSNREVVLNEIKEAVDEAHGLIRALHTLQALVLSKPDTGVVKIRPETQLLNGDDLVPAFNWLLSIYESFYCIGYWGVHPDQIKKATRSFADIIANPYTVTASIPPK